MSISFVGGKSKEANSQLKPSLDKQEAEFKVMSMSWATAQVERLIARGLVPSKDEKENLDYQKVVSLTHATTTHLAGIYFAWLKGTVEEAKA